MTSADARFRAWALLFARLVLGLIFFMAGVSIDHFLPTRHGARAER